MGDDARAAIVCADWSEETLMALPGNRTAECPCGQPVVISRQGLKLQAEQGALVKCMRCARREAPDVPVRSVPGAVAAARAAGVPITGADAAALEGMTVAEFVDGLDRP